MAPGDGIAYTPCGAGVRLFIRLFSAIIFYFCSDAASAAVVLFWQLLLLLLLLFFARLVTRAKVAACAVREERKNCCAIASTVAWIFASSFPERECVAQSSSRQFKTIYLYFSRQRQFFLGIRKGECEREAGGRVTQPCLIMLIYANNQCKASDNECERERERERERRAWGTDKTHAHTHAKQLSRAKTKRYKIHSSRHT